jgi:hypothetical protein
MRSELVTALFVAVMFTTSALMVYGGSPESPTLSVTANGATATVQYSLPSWAHHYPSALTVVPVDGYRSDDIAILMTGMSGPPNSDPANVQGLADHLGAELENIGSSSTVTIIGEGALFSYLAAGNGTLVVASQLSDAQGDMVEKWVMAGGLLIAIGPECIPFIGYGGSVKVGLNNFVYDGSATEGTLAHDIGLRTVYPVHGILVSDVLSSSGTVLGHTTVDGKLTTTAVVPLGEGKILMMGGPIESPFLASMEDVYAWDLARLLEAGMPWAAGPLFHERLEVPSQGLEGIRTFFVMNMTVRVALFSLDDSHALFQGVTHTP